MRYFFPWFSLFIVIFALLIPVLSILYLYDLNKGFELSEYVISITYFTLYQSLFSSFFATIIGCLFAYLLIKHEYIPGINYIINSLSILFVLPTTISIFGILSFYGEFIDIYGFSGILLGHTILNIPLVSRIIFQSLKDISPNERLLAQQMTLNFRALFFAIEWPIIKKNIPSIFVLISFICFVSFTPALILGGSPKYSTLEVAIYQAVIFANDYNNALNFLGIQMSICIVIYILFFRNFKSKNLIIDENKKYLLLNSFSYKYFFEYFILTAITFLIFSPILFVILKGLNASIIQVLSSNYFWPALFTTLIISFFSGLLAVILTYSNLILLNKSNKISELWFYVLIIFSPAIMAIGYYIFFNEILSFDIPNIFIVILINSIFIVPFTYNYLSPSFFRITQEHYDISESINIYGLRRFLIIDFPRLKEPIFTAFCISSILSASDLVIISFFGTNNLSTLTQTIYRLMGSYRMEEAYAVALLLLIYCFLYFIVSYKLVLKKWNTL